MLRALLCSVCKMNGLMLLSQQNGLQVLEGPCCMYANTFTSRSWCDICCADVSLGLRSNFLSELLKSFVVSDHWLKHLLLQHTNDSCYGCFLPSPMSESLVWNTITMSKSKYLLSGTEAWNHAGVLVLFVFSPILTTVSSSPPTALIDSKDAYLGGRQLKWRSLSSSPFCIPAPRNILTYCPSVRLALRGPSLQAVHYSNFAKWEPGCYVGVC